MKTLAVVLGTRPEIIKLAPLVLKLREHAQFQVKIIATGQHSSMAEQAFESFGIAPDIQFRLMTHNQSPNSFLASLLPKLEESYEALQPAGVVVQGDTTTALGGALAAFHNKIPVAHVEAGLRTHNLHSPFPEEMNRTLLGSLATIHFPHSEAARENLRTEGIRENVFVVGNTVVDALHLILHKIERGEISVESQLPALTKRYARVVLVTGHRRENFDGPLRNLCNALRMLAASDPTLGVFYPVHLNPNVQSVVNKELSGQEHIHLLDPLDYASFVWMMQQSTFIVSDSGGVQEEAPSLGKYVFITRANTERPECVEAGYAEVVSLESADTLSERMKEFLQGSLTESRGPNPFGDGSAAEKISRMLALKI